MVGGGMVGVVNGGGRDEHTVRRFRGSLTSSGANCCTKAVFQTRGQWDVPRESRDVQSRE